MKKIISFILILVFVFSLSACTIQTTDKYTENDNTSSIKDKNNAETQNTDNEEISDVELFEIGEILTYTEAKDYTNTSNIKIQYPIFDFARNDINNDIVNDAITRSLGIILEVTDEDSSSENNNKLEGIIGYEIQMATKKIISITFSGLINGDNFAYPTNVFFALNINPQTGMLIKQDEILDATPENLFSIFKESRCYYSSDEHKEYFTEISNNELLEYLDKIDSYNDNLLSNKCSYYFTDNGICISLPILHSMGDYAKINVSHTVL